MANLINRTVENVTGWFNDRAPGFVPFYNNPEQMAALLKADIAKYARLIKAANIKSE